jgi:heme-degrading monooxygenase HmoA
MSRGMWLAQFNVARMAADRVDDPRMAGFVAELARINGLADAAPGFVWRYQTDRGDSVDVRPYPDDPRLLMTLSVWESLDDLRAFTYRGEHARVMAGRRQWFEEPGLPSLVLWWVPAGPPPAVEEGVRRLELLRHLGPTPDAFTFKVPFPPPVGAAR